MERHQTYGDTSSQKQVCCGTFARSPALHVQPGALFSAELPSLNPLICHQFHQANHAIYRYTYPNSFLVWQHPLLIYLLWIIYILC